MNSHLLFSWLDNFWFVCSCSLSSKMRFLHWLKPWLAFREGKTVQHSDKSEINDKLFKVATPGFLCIVLQTSRMWAEWIKNVYIRSCQNCTKCIFISAIIIMPSFSGSFLFFCKKFHTCTRVMQWDRHHRHGCIYKCHSGFWKSQIIGSASPLQLCLDCEN